MTGDKVTGVYYTTRLDGVKLFRFAVPNTKTGDEWDEWDKPRFKIKQDQTGALYNEARVRVESSFNNYRGDRRSDVEDYWNEVKDAFRSSPDMGDMTVIIDDVEEGLSQYTDVSQLHEYILRRIFGDR